jgi:hypothetical protein
MSLIDLDPHGAQSEDAPPTIPFGDAQKITLSLWESRPLRAGEGLRVEPDPPKNLTI